MSIDFGVPDGGSSRLRWSSKQSSPQGSVRGADDTYSSGTELVWAGEDRTKDEGRECFIVRFHTL